MSKPLQPYPHGILDYVAGLTILAAPWLLQINDESTIATNVMVAVGATILVVSVLTRYPLGLLKMIPFKVHGVLETVGILGFMASPWLFGYEDISRATGFAVTVSVVYLIVIAMTNYTESAYDNRLSSHRPAR